MNQTSDQPLRVQNLGKSYGDTIALSEVSFEVQTGECVAILGPNGAGKTTAVSICVGLLDHDRGEVNLWGKSWRQERHWLQTQIGVILQDSHFYKRFSVRETLTLFASFYPDCGAKQIDAVIAALELAVIADRRFADLSGGQKQRVALAVAMVHQPRLLFLDEPTTGLDPQARRTLWQVLKEAKEQGKSMLLTTHFMDEAAYLADRVVIIDHAKVVATGAPAELIAKASQGHRLQILVPDSQRAGFATNLTSAGLPPIMADDGRINIDVDNPATAVARVIDLALTQQIQIEGLAIHPATLEDVFIEKTGRRLRDV